MMKLLPCLRSLGPQRTSLQVHAVPGAKRTEVLGLHDDALRVRVASPPIDGRANDALIKWLAKALDVPRRELVLSQGQTSRRKVLEIERPGECLDRTLRAWLAQKPPTADGEVSIET